MQIFLCPELQMIKFSKISLFEHPVVLILNMAI